MTGEFRVTQCPHEYVAEISQAIPLFDLFGKGMPPIAGGALDQSAWFLAAYRTLQSEEAAMVAESSNG